MQRVQQDRRETREIREQLDHRVYKDYRGNKASKGKQVWMQPRPFPGQAGLTQYILTTYMTTSLSRFVVPPQTESNKLPSWVHAVQTSPKGQTPRPYTLTIAATAEQRHPPPSSGTQLPTAGAVRHIIHSW